MGSCSVSSSIALHDYTLFSKTTTSVNLAVLLKWEGIRSGFGCLPRLFTLNRFCSNVLSGSISDTARKIGNWPNMYSSVFYIWMLCVACFVLHFVRISYNALVRAANQGSSTHSKSAWCICQVSYGQWWVALSAVTCASPPHSCECFLPHLKLYVMEHQLGGTWRSWVCFLQVEVCGV